MTVRFRIDTTKRTVLNKSFDPTKTRLQLSGVLLRRILLFAFPFVPLAIVGFYLNQPFGAIFGLVFAGFLILWQVVAYGYRQITPADLDAVKIYGRGRLIVGLCLLAAFVILVSVALYMRFPRT